MSSTHNTHLLHIIICDFILLIIIWKSIQIIKLLFSCHRKCNLYEIWGCHRGIMITVYWGVTPHSSVGRYLLPNHTGSYPSKPWSSNTTSPYNLCRNRGTEGTAPCIPSQWSKVKVQLPCLCSKSLQYPLNRMLGGPHTWYGHFGEDKTSCPYQKLKYGSSVAKTIYIH